MKILMICFVYNELKYLPHTINYYKKNGCEVYVIDNYSTDGTYEWLVDNNIPSHRVNTNDSFDLRILQKEILDTLPKLNPDWIIYGAADLYYIVDSSLSKYIEKIDALGYNQISMMCYGAINTGEQFNLPLPLYYYYAYRWKSITMISKYITGLNMIGDNVAILNPNCYECKDGLVINYGACKPPEEQDVKLLRRSKAWDNGMSKWQGTHYIKGKELNWKYKKEGAIDLRKIEDYKYILNLNKYF